MALRYQVLPPKKHPVLLADRGGADDVFDQVRVDRDAAVFRVDQGVVPYRKGVVDGLDQGALGQDLRLAVEFE
jgi:hypothetical protein